MNWNHDGKHTPYLLFSDLLRDKHKEAILQFELKQEGFTFTGG